MTNDFLTIRNVYFRGIVSIEFKTGGGGGLSEGTPPLISGFLLPRRGGEGLSVEEFQTGGICVFDDGLTRLVLLVIGDLNPRSERKREGLITEGNEIDWYINLSL